MCKGLYFTTMATPVIIITCFVFVTGNGRGNEDKYTPKGTHLYCIKCLPGFYVTAHCTVNITRSVCKECDANEYVADGQADICAPCTKCSEGEQHDTWKNCTSTEDTKCVCEKHQYLKDDICDVCEPPEVVFRSASDVDGTCGPCENGTFFNTSSKNCSLCSVPVCEAVETASLCNSSHDAVCITAPTSRPITPPTSRPITQGLIAGIVIAVAFIIGFIIVGIYVYLKYPCRCRIKNTDTNTGNQRECANGIVDVTGNHTHAEEVPLQTGDQ